MKNKVFSDFQNQLGGLIEIEKISREIFKKDIDLSANFEFDVLSICSHQCYGNYNGSTEESFENLKRIVSFLKSTGRKYYATLTYKDSMNRVFVEIFFYPPEVKLGHESFVDGFVIVYGTDTFGMDDNVTSEIKSFFRDNGKHIDQIMPERFGNKVFSDFFYQRIKLVDVYEI